MNIELTPTHILKLGALLLGVQEANPGTMQADHANEILDTICKQVDERFDKLGDAQEAINIKHECPVDEPDIYMSAEQHDEDDNPMNYPEDHYRP